MRGQAGFAKYFAVIPPLRKLVYLMGARPGGLRFLAHHFLTAFPFSSFMRGRQEI